MKEQLKEIGYWLEDKLKELCGEITPEKRLTGIIIMLLVFTCLNLYLTFTSINNWGRHREGLDRLKIKHIKHLELDRVKPKTLDLDIDFLDSEPDIPLSDSINSIHTQIKEKQYGG